jgi:Fe-S-cluster containining protein
MDMFPCDGCAAPCCRFYTIYLDGSDAYRISRTLKVPMADFLELQPSADPGPEWSIRLDDGTTRYRMHLKKVKDPDPEYSTRCMFLVTIGDRGRCGIYAMRPSLCAAYPTSYTHGLIGLADGGQYCPPDSWQMESLDVPVFRLWHRRKRQGKIVYGAVVDAWNARAENAPPRLFYHFLFNAYQELETRAPELLGDAGLDGPAADRIAETVAELVKELR